MYLKTGSTIVGPTDAGFDLSGTVLHLRFEGNFTEGKAYSLVFNAASFFTRRNTSASFDAGVMGVGHNYSIYPFSLLLLLLLYNMYLTS